MAFARLGGRRDRSLSTWWVAGITFTLAHVAGMSAPLFWSSLLVSLTAGLLAAYPVNVLLVWRGVKSGMANPRERAESSPA